MSAGVFTSLYRDFSKSQQEVFRTLKLGENSGQLKAVNPLQPGVAFLCPLKTSENLFSGGIEKQHWPVMG